MTMRITQLRIAQMISIVRAAREDCLVIPGRTTLEDGSIVVARGSKKSRLHRILWEKTRTPLKGRCLVRNCETFACQNPYHFEIPNQVKAERCPNGHRYAEVGELPSHLSRRCAKCYEIHYGHPWRSRSRRIKCQNDHRLTRDNLYEWTDERGTVHRRCKTCHLNRIRENRAAKHIEQEKP